MLGIQLFKVNFYFIEMMNTVESRLNYHHISSRYHCTVANPKQFYFIIIIIIKTTKTSHYRTKLKQTLKNATEMPRQAEKSKEQEKQSTEKKNEKAGENITNQRLFIR